MTITQHHLCLLLAAAMLPAWPAATQTPDGPARTPEQRAERRAATFARLDRNADGFNAPAEIDAAVAAAKERRAAAGKPAGKAAESRGKRLMSRLDHDGDGRLSRQEFLTAPPRRRPAEAG